MSSTPDDVHSESAIRRVLSEYVPPKVVALVMDELRGRVEAMPSVPQPTDKQRIYARRRLKEIGYRG